MDRKRGTEPTFQHTVDNPNEAPVWPTKEGDLGQGILVGQRQPDHDVLTQEEPRPDQFDKNVAAAHEIAEGIDDGTIPFAEPETEPARRRKGISKKGRIALMASGAVGAIGVGVAAGAIFLGKTSNDVSAGPTPDTEPVATSSPNPGASETETSQEVTEETVEFRSGETTYKSILTDPYESVGAKEVVPERIYPIPEAHNYAAGAEIVDHVLTSAQHLSGLEVTNAKGDKASELVGQAIDFTLGEGALADFVKETQAQGLKIESYSDIAIYGLESDGLIHSTAKITVVNPETQKQTIYNARIGLEAKSGAWHTIDQVTDVWIPGQQ